jgi:hypothetical protein
MIFIPANQFKIDHIKKLKEKPSQRRNKDTHIESNTLKHATATSQQPRQKPRQQLPTQVSNVIIQEF